MRHWRITGNSNVAIQTGSTYISDSMTGITAIPTANLGFSTTPNSRKLTLGDCNNDRQPEITIWTFCSPVLQFLAVGRCHNHMANRHRKSLIWRLIFDAIWQSTTDVITSGFGRHVDISVCRLLLYLLGNIILHQYMVLYPRIIVEILTEPFIA